MFGPLTVCFVISYIVHLAHVRKVQTADQHAPVFFQVMKLVRMRQQGLDDDDFEGKTYSRVRYQRIREGNQISYFCSKQASAMLSMRGLERQNTTFLHVRPEDEFEDHKHPWTNY